MKARAFAPASIGNLAVGFDILGLAFPSVGDEVEVRRIPADDGPTVTITEIHGASELPLDSEHNTASAALLHLARDQGLADRFEIAIHKKIPLSSGMGGSAASAVAAVVAASALLSTPLPADKLLDYALTGESVASGERHADNVAPCLFGGLTLIVSANDTQRIISVPMPDIFCVLVHPDLKVNTKEARRILPQDIPLRESVAQSGLLAGFLAGCFRNDHELIRFSLKDIIVEPKRARLVPGFSEVQRAALARGALGCSLSGSGPSVFAFAETKADAQHIRMDMLAAFKNNGITADGWISKPSPLGAGLVSHESKNS